MRRSWLALPFLVWATCAWSSVSCPHLDIAEVPISRSFDRLSAAYTVSTQGSPSRWILLLGRNATVNADGSPSSYEVSDHGVSYLCDGMCVGRQGSCSSRGDACKSASELVKLLPSTPQGLRVICEGEFAVFRRTRFFGFKALGTLERGYTDCGNTILPISSEGSDDRLRYLVPATALSLRDGSALSSNRVPFFVAPSDWNKVMPSNLHFGLADVGVVIAPYSDGVLQSSAVVGDLGPEGAFGEGSIALHQRLTIGELIDPPPFLEAPGRRHPRLSEVPIPFMDTCDGDLRAKVSAEGVWAYLINPGSGNAEIRRAESSDALATSIDARVSEIGASFGGVQCLVDSLVAKGVIPRSTARPERARWFGRTSRQCR